MISFFTIFTFFSIPAGFSNQITQVLNGLFFNQSTIDRIAKQFETEMNLALNEQFDEASLLMENTYIPELPDGTGAHIIMEISFQFNTIFFSLVNIEQGKFLALDLGGTNFRVILLELKNGKVINEVVKMYHIGHEIRVGDETVAVALFDFIGQCLCDFVEENDLVSVPLPLGELK